MTVRSISSSSKGNAYLVESGGSAVLIDCGVPYKAIAGYSFDAVLVTHNHTDHVCGLKTLLKKRKVPVFANLMTAETTAVQEGLDSDAFVCFENGQCFDIGPFTVRPFSIPHDTPDPVGYLVSAGGITYFHGTDIGSPLDSIGVKLAEADIATLESNHDDMLLRECRRPACVKQRIAGPRGHLSNFEAAELVRRFASPRLRRLSLAHLSRECNTPYLAERMMRETLADMGRTDVVLDILY